jgi:hypothetical protein
MCGPRNRHGQGLLGFTRKQGLWVQRNSLLLICGENMFMTANPPAQPDITGRKRRRRCQIGLKQEKQSIGRDVKIEIYEAMQQDSANCGNSARMKGRRKVTLVGRETIFAPL